MTAAVNQSDHPPRADCLCGPVKEYDDGVTTSNKTWVPMIIKLFFTFVTGILKNLYMTGSDLVDVNVRSVILVA